jgi:hypothetical protein
VVKGGAGVVREGKRWNGRSNMAGCVARS